MWSLVPSSSVLLLSKLCLVCTGRLHMGGAQRAPSRVDCLATSTPLLVAPAACTYEGAAVSRTRGHFVLSYHVYGMPACLPELT